MTSDLHVDSRISIYGATIHYVIEAIPLYNIYDLYASAMSFVGLSEIRQQYLHFHVCPFTGHDINMVVLHPGFICIIYMKTSRNPQP